MCKPDVLHVVVIDIRAWFTCTKSLRRWRTTASTTTNQWESLRPCGALSNILFHVSLDRKRFLSLDEFNICQQKWKQRWGNRTGNGGNGAPHDQAAGLCRFQTSERIKSQVGSFHHSYKEPMLPTTCESTRFEFDSAVQVMTFLDWHEMKTTL